MDEQDSPVDECFISPDPETAEIIRVPLDGKPVKRSKFHSNKQLNRVASHCPPGMMTKGMVMESLNLSERNFKKYVEDGVLEACGKHPTRDWVWYSERDVTKLKQMMVIRLQGIPQKEDTRPLEFHSYSLEAAKFVFNILNEKKDLLKLVDQLNIHPLALRAILRDYTALSESILISQRQMAIINTLPLEGQFPIKTSEALVKLLHDLSFEKKCPKCKTSDRTHLCGPCYVEAKKASGKKAETEKQKREAAAKLPPVQVDDEEDETSFDLGNEEREDAKGVDRRVEKDETSFDLGDEDLTPDDTVVVEPPSLRTG